MPESPNPPPSQLPLAARLAIDDVCDAFEADLRAGLAPRVEEFLGNRPEPERAYLLAELAKIEQEYRARGEARTTVPYQPHGRDRDAGLPSVPGYEILSVLGRGGMGVVYRARQLEPSRPVALKMMRAGEFATADERQRFRFEAQTVAALDHPGIVPIYGVGEVGGEPFLCLKYIEKGSLARRMKERSYSPKEAAALVAEVAAAVQHAHDRGVLHRDLKPGNILLDADEKPHVADFGLARRLAAEHSLSPTGAILGTLDYMAPEQARSNRGITVQADVFALGAILYELLTGTPPLKGDTDTETLCNLLQDKPVVRPRDRNRAVPRDLEAVCLKCLEKNPDNRYGSAKALATDLANFLSGKPVSAQQPGAWDWLAQALRLRPDPELQYAWPVPFWLAGVTLAQHASVFFLARSGQPVWTVWAVVLAGWVGAALILWLMLLRHFRLLPVTERHSIVLTVGTIAAQLTLFVSLGPLDPGAPSRLVLPLYPSLIVVSGFGFFVLGSTNWGRFLLIGLAVMAVAPVAAAWPEAGPLLFALVVPFWLAWWGTSKWWYFGRRGT